MHLFLVVLSIAAIAGAVPNPAPDPIQAFKRAGPAAGTIIQKCSKPGVLALAFDDGPAQYEQTLIDTLNVAGAKATFFVTGTLYGCIYKSAASVRSAYQSGHQIASHSWSHPQNFGQLDAATLRTEMQKLETALVNLIGVKPTYMRPPYLASSANINTVMKELGYRIITDDIDSGDWNGLTVAQSEQRFTSAGASGNGHIPLMHETYESTVKQLVPWLIQWAKQNNLKLVTVAECLGDPNGAYTAGKGDNSKTC